MKNEVLLLDLESCKEKLIEYLKDEKFKKFLMTVNKLSEKYLVKPSKYDRFNDVLPYNNEVSEKYGIDYVNASFIDVGKDFYLACQEPKEEFDDLFLELVIKAKIRLIVALNGKCNYFKKIKPFQSEIIKYKEKDFIIIEKYNMGEYEMVRAICLGWPDKGIMMRDEMDFLQSNIISFKHLPTLVHCRAGVGRTGTFIMYLQSYKTGKITVEEFFNMFVSLRIQRHLFVETAIQLKFLYEVFVI